ncbi:MAG: HYR domain-containing protein, partial [Saprospiraceae bacterium]|nr:HYR domain-containing protein [Saprospiraceae bacterium]
SMTTFPVGTTTNIFVVTDASNNTNTCSFTVTVNDVENPTITCPMNITVNNDPGVCGAGVEYGISSSDNCPGQTVMQTAGQASMTTFPVGTTTNIFVVTDASNNTNTCSFTVTVNDNEDPFISCPSDITVDNDPGLCSADVFYNVSISDNCPGVMLSQDSGGGPTFEVGTTEVCWTATDAAGNDNSCCFNVTVNDNEDPFISCPANITVDNDPGLCSADVFYNISINDNCPGVMLSQDSGGGPTFEIGTTEVCWTATDAAGNDNSCCFNVTVNDNEAPTAVCQMATVVLDGAGAGLLAAADVDGGSFDNCPDFELEVNPDVFGCEDVGPQTTILSITDASENSDNCVAVVDVIASLACTPPEIRNYGGPNVTDPCTCLTNGKFSEEIVIGPANAGQMWTVVSTSLINPATLLPYPAGTVFIEYPITATTSMYALQGIHLDGIGYSMEVSSIYWPGQNLSISNTCYYPDPEILNLDGDFCLFSEAVPLVGDVGGVDLESEEFTINGVPSTEFDPMVLGIGCHLVKYTVDAGTAGSFDPLDPGCVASTTMTVCVIETPATVSCNDTIQVSVDQNCEALLTPDDFLEGSYGCYDDYEVIVFDGINQIPTSPVIGVEYLGEYLTVQVHHLVSGNYCWSTVILEDKLPPVFDCSTTPVVINCDANIDNVPPPFALDNCTSVDYLLVNEMYTDTDICDDNIVEVQRSWIAVDEYNNQSAVCIQIIHITRPTDIDFPDDVQWECTTFEQHPNVTDATPLTGNLNTTGSGIPNAPTGGYCNYNVTHSDQVISTCGNTFKIIRTWTVLDWCTNSAITSNDAGEDNVQIIEVMDSQPPVITMLPFEVSANVNGVHPNPCNSQDFLPPATVTDACNDWTLRIYTEVGEAIYVNGVDGLAGGNIPFPGLELGDHEITYAAEDACGNIAELVVVITVVDDYSPVAICDEITDISLSSNGLADVSAFVFDDGSYDNCGIETYLARRMDGDCNGAYDDFDENVIFCCSDVDNGPIMVVFRVVDYYGNSNDCMVQVNVNDKLPPINTYCPPAVTINCEVYLEDLEAAVNNGNYSVLDVYGTATFIDNCGVDVAYFVSTNIDNCQAGTIVRTWTGTDAAQNSPAVCSQTIFVEHHSDWVIEFPADINEVCVDSDLIFPGEPTVYYDECELIGISFEDQIFNIVPDACYKIVRTWTAINWCVYNDWGYDAFLEQPENAYFLDFDNDGDSDSRTYRDGWNSTGAPGTADGYIVHKQIIKVTDNTPPSFVIPEIDGCIVDTDCNTDITIPYPDIEDPCGSEWDVNISGDFGVFNNISGDVVISDVSPGTYTIYYAVSDNCGNTSYQSVDVEVVDCKLPTPYCLGGLVVEIMQTQMIEVWASDLDAGSFDNCPGDLIISFSSDITTTSMVMDCGSLGLNPVTIWVTDAAGNQDFCETILWVQDNMGNCGSPSLALGGLIATELDEGVEDVMVDINAGLATVMTDEDGLYEIQLAEGGDYTVVPSLDINPGNGVTTYDMVLISQHILGIQQLDSPYKIIAADANNSESVSTLDLVAIQKLILQVASDFPNNTSWRFVDADYVFPNPLDPWQENFPEVISYNNLPQSQLQTDFIAVKVGDVNLSAATNNLAAGENRTQEDVLSIIVEEVVLVYNTSPTIWFEGADQAVLGYQFTLNFDPEKLAFEALLPAVAKAENFGLTYVEEGVITVSWHDAFPLEMGAGEKQFGIRFTALADGKLSDALSITSSYTAAEAYPGDFTGTTPPWGVALEFVQTTDEAAQTALYQNVPNPFAKQTDIRFFLGTPGKVKLSVLDINGREIRVYEQEYPAGYNEWKLGDMPASGVYFYQMETAGFKATRKMIVQ